MWQVLGPQDLLEVLHAMQKGLVLCRGAVDSFNIALARSPPLAAAVKVESVVGRQGKMADVGRASIRRGCTE